MADAGINGKHVHNNKHERKNGEFGDCLYRGRGYWDGIPGRVRLTVLYQNFIHRPECSNSRTPAGVPGVIVAGLDRFKTQIRQAALAAARLHQL